MAFLLSRLSLVITGLLITLLCALPSHALEDNRRRSAERIVSLSPHLTELVYLLNAQDKLVAVSDYSDYPAQASKLPSVASYQGVDFEQIVRLKPDLILAWQGGNKPQDLARLKALGFSLYYSAPKTLNDISKEVRELGYLLNQSSLAERVAKDFDQRLLQIKTTYNHQKITQVFYYLWPKPLMTIGQNAWGNELLSACNANNVFGDAINDYPEVPLESVIRRQPSIIVAVNKEPRTQVMQFWTPWLSLLELNESHVKQANPDLLHRFTPRLLDGLKTLCAAIHETR